jgi:hypothetical protein
MKRFRILCRRELLPLVTAMDVIPHLTVIISISGGGNVVKPIVILKNLQNLGELIDLEPHCLFATSVNGWTTKDLWIYYALVFSAQMSEYHLSLPETIRDNEIFLVTDGHKNRLSFLAAMIFVLNSIEVLVLPGHSIHLLQMFDVFVTFPLKTTFKQELEKWIDHVTHADPDHRKKAQIIRRVLVESFINALRCGATPDNVEFGFRSTGFISFNPQASLDSAYTVDHVDPELFRPRPTETEVNEMIMTSPEGLKFLCRQENRRKVMEDDYQIE